MDLLLSISQQAKYTNLVSERFPQIRNSSSLSGYKVCSALDPDKGTELELTVYTLTVHDGGVNQGLCAESKMYIDDLRVKGGVILGRGWEVHVFFVSAQRCGCAVAPPGAAFCPGCMLFLYTANACPRCP